MPTERIGSAELLAMGRRKVIREIQLNPAELARLSESMAVGAGDVITPLKVSIQFQVGPEGFPLIQLGIAGNLGLECQRCLAPVGWSVNLQAQLTVMANDEETNRVTDPFECVVMDADGLLLSNIIEDEILAALPMAPFHRSGTGCAVSSTKLVEADNGRQQMNRPFLDLAALMGRDGEESDE
jgi:uncharacterized metal-binding protein YceD (DUF177 family)